MTVFARSVQRYGWRRDLPDARDVPLEAVALLPKPPPHVDLRDSGHLNFEIYDQGQLGSCTANGISAALRFTALKQGLPDVAPSRLWIYWQERAIEGTTDSDSGAQVRDGLKVVSSLGWPPESEWPYDPARFADRPSAQVDKDAAKDRVTRYFRVAVDRGMMQSALALGYPLVVGFTVYESFESPEVAATGNVPLPDPEEEVVGGHCVLCVGYDQVTHRWLCRNSWDASWGQEGYFTLPMGYLDSPDLAGDFWTIRSETEGEKP